MKTTLDLNDELLAEAKALAARQRTTLTRVVEEGLQLRLQRHAQPSKHKNARSHLRVFEGQGGLQPGVDPSSNKSALQAADEA